MSRKIAELKKLIDQYLGQSKDFTIKHMGKPLKKSDDYAWLYRKFSLSPFMYEIVFIFEEDTVVDIMINEYFLWLEVSSAFYQEGGDPQYKVIKFY